MMMIKINSSSLLISTIFIGFFIYCNSQQAGLCRKKTKANGGLFEHEEYCDYYWRCDSRKSEPYLQACPNGLAFAGKGRGLYEFCGYPHLLKTCDGEIRYQAQEPVTSENCPYSYGIFPHKTSCAKYYQCWNNTASEQKCGFQLLYNEEISSCDYPSNVKGCQKHPICKEVPNGPVLLKGSCILYWQCVGGYPRLERCPAGLAVNPKTLKCELATTVPECADKIKVTSPKEDEESEDDKNEKKKKEANARIVTLAKAAKESKNQKDAKNQKELKNSKEVPKNQKEVAKNQKEVVKNQREVTKNHRESSNKNQKEASKNQKEVSKNHRESSNKNQKEQPQQNAKEVKVSKSEKRKKKKQKQKQQQQN